MRSRPLTATYRLQFGPDFSFADAEALVPYLSGLGVSHVYASPVFAARPGSTHGYDGVDPGRISDALGGMAGFRRMAAALQSAGLGLILDIVPNHLAIHRSNAAWMETLCLGPAAPGARMFDLDWSRGPLHLPVLDAALPDVAAQGGLSVYRDVEAGYLVVGWHDHAFPLRPRSAAALLQEAGLHRQARCWHGLEETPDEAAIAAARAELAALNAAAAAALEQVLTATDPAGLLDAQHWHLDDWRTSRATLSHRRFFNINDLIGVRVEDPEVFDRTHHLAIDLVREGLVDGLRIDHIDGLADPEAYCRRLRQAVGPDAILFVEKILEHRESLRDWPVDGTTGYEILCDINELFVDPEEYHKLESHLRSRGELSGTPQERLASAKRQILTESFNPELDRLTALAEQLEAGEPAALRQGLIAVLSHFPVYRSYATDHGHSREDEALWERALAATARHEAPSTHAAAARLVGCLRTDRSEAGCAFRTGFQQLSGPAMAKGLEDTELYRSIVLGSRNEVGGTVEPPRRSIEAAHIRFRDRARRRSLGLVPLATHDTKRGADARARLNALALDASAWIRDTERWRTSNRRYRGRAGDASAPDGIDEWLIYQTLVAAWPIGADRLSAYLTKAMREAKRHTRWEAPDTAYEAGTLAFAEALLGAGDAGQFRSELADSVRRVELAGRVNGIAQTILQLTVPGIPDIYRGTELWDHALVDPDNRRPVDWALRRRLLDRPLARLALKDDTAGATKLRVVRALLELRRRVPSLFLDGDYTALADLPDAWFGFLRRSGEHALLVVVPLRGGGGERAPALTGPGSTWSDVWRDAILGTSFEIQPGMPPSLDPDWPFLAAIREG